MRNAAVASSLRRRRLTGPERAAPVAGRPRRLRRAKPQRAAQAALAPSAREEAALYAAAFSLLAALIHAEAAALHFGHIWWYGALFSLLAGFQAAWGVQVRRNPSPALLGAGIAVSLGAIGVWALSRTAGFPVGPEAWEPEPVGPLDAGAVLAQAEVACLAWALARDAYARLATSAGRLAANAALTLAGLALFLGGGHAH